MSLRWRACAAPLRDLERMESSVDCIVCMSRADAEKSQHAFHDGLGLRERVDCYMPFGAMAVIEPEVVEGPVTEEPLLFFRSLGALAFSSPSGNDTASYPGNASAVAAAAPHGVVFFADHTGAGAQLCRDGLHCGCFCHMICCALISITRSAMSLCAGLYVAPIAALLSAATTDDEVTCADTITTECCTPARHVLPQLV